MSRKPKSNRELLDAYNLTQNPVTKASYRNCLIQRVPNLIRDQELLERLLEELRLMTHIQDSSTLLDSLMEQLRLTNDLR